MTQEFTTKYIQVMLKEWTHICSSDIILHTQRVDNLKKWGIYIISMWNKKLRWKGYCFSVQKESKGQQALSFHKEVQ